MSTITVTTLADTVDANDKLTSLREAISEANGNVGADTITFDAGLSSGLIRLGSTLVVTGALTINGDIDGDHSADITITGDVNGDDALVGATTITDIAATTTAGHLSDNVQILTSTADLAIDGLVLTGGNAVTDRAHYGGAAFSTVAVSLTDSTVSGNTAKLGGGIAAFQYTGPGNPTIGNITVINSTVSDNSATSQGGGIYASKDVTLTNSTVSGNTAAEGGGGMTVYEAVNITNSTVSGNSVTLAGGTGGGIECFFKDVTLTNSTVSGNSADWDGGGINAFNAVNVINSTISGNISNRLGSGIFTYQDINLTNSIVLGNTGSKGGDLYSATTSLTGGNILGTDVFKGSVDVGDTTASAVFASLDANGGGLLANNGGSVETIALNASATNPALDASNASAPSTDAAGDARFDQVIAANINGSAADLGARELTEEVGGTFNGTAGGDVLRGTGKDDILLGGAGNDRIDGGAGDDVLIGGSGRDFLTGGAGHDTFQFSSMRDTLGSNGRRDLINDFTHGEDHIDVSGIDANSHKVGNQAFKFISDNGFHHKAGELHYVLFNVAGTAHDRTRIEGDTNGDGQADFQIVLRGLHALTAHDFVL